MSDSVPKYHRYRLGTVPAQIPGGEHCPVPAGLPERGEAEAPDPATPTPPFADKCAAVPRTTSADGVAHVSEAPGNRVQILAWTDALRSLPETHRSLQVTHRFARSLAGVSVGAVRRLDSTDASSGKGTDVQPATARSGATSCSVGCSMPASFRIHPSSSVCHLRSRSSGRTR